MTPIRAIASALILLVPALLDGCGADDAQRRVQGRTVDGGDGSGDSGDAGGTGGAGNPSPDAASGAPSVDAARDAAPGAGGVPEAAAPGDDASLDGSVDSGGASADSGPRDSGPAACNRVPLPTQVVTPFFRNDALPPALTGGGVVPDGTYRLIARSYWGGTQEHAEERARITLNGGVVQAAYAWDAFIPETHATYSVSFARATYTETVTCGGTGTTRYSYQVVPGTSPLEVEFLVTTSASSATLVRYVQEN